jgi:hypothetical protein
MRVTVYTEKPKSGKGKLAWEKFEKQMGRPPYSVEYSPNYDHEYKGWICEYFPPDVSIPIQSEQATHAFYLSSELQDTV